MTVHEGPPLDGPVRPLTLAGFLDEVTARHGTREALVLDDPLRDGATVRWTYADLHERATRIGRALVADGVAPGDPVAVVMANRPEAVAALFGIALAGGVAVLVSTFAPGPELAAMLDRAGVGTVLTQARLGRRALADEVAATDPRRHLVAVGTPGWDAFLTAGDGHGGDRPVLAPATDPDATALVIFSSGTTSEPKGVVHGHRSPTHQFWVQAEIFGRHPGTRMFTALPMFWTAGLNTAMGSTLAAGGCWVMQEVFAPGPALALLARERVTEPYTLPHQTVALAEHPEWGTTDLSALRCVYGKGAFARHPSVVPDPGWMMPAGYGLSETCAYFAAHRSTTPRAEMVVGLGRLLPGNRVVVRDPASGRALGPGEEGELCLAGPTLFQRYLGAAPADRLDPDGFFPTGDVGRVDSDGVLHFTGRLSEVIRTGGANVSPAEVEVALRACPPVKLSRVVGLPDERLGQVVVACITRRDDADATAEDVRAFLRQRIAAYKVPRHVLFFADGEIPMTRSDTKVRDDALLALVQERIGTPTPTRGER